MQGIEPIHIVKQGCADEGRGGRLAPNAHETAKKLAIKQIL